MLPCWGAYFDSSYKSIDKISRFPIEGVLSSRMVFLYWDHFKVEKVTERVLLSVPNGEPVLTSLITLRQVVRLVFYHAFAGITQW